LHITVRPKVFRLGMLSVKAKGTTFRFNVPWKVEKLILDNMEDTIAIIK
jgi:hypothetical protein